MSIKKKLKVAIDRSFSDGFTHTYLGIFALPINMLLSLTSKIIKPLVR
jgi:hypothetical protein